MGLLVDITQTLNAVMGIDLRGSQTAMSKQFFDCIQLCTISREMSSKTMAKNVWTFLLRSGD